MSLNLLLLLFYCLESIKVFLLEILISALKFLDCLSFYLTLFFEFFLLI